MDRKIHVFWCSDNDLSETRQASLKSLIDKSGCKIELVTNKNINKYIIEPFHEGYKYLSAIHKCDYWKAYFAYFYGCGYSDIKICEFDWNPYFEQLEANEEAFMVSYSESGGGGVALRSESAARKINLSECIVMVRKAHLIPGCGHWVYKKGTSMAKKWREVQHKILDDNMDTLKNNPGTYHIGAVKGGVHFRYNNESTAKFKGSKYPFCWSEFGGMISHELGYENKEKCILTMPKPICGDHWK